MRSLVPVSSAQAVDPAVGSFELSTGAYRVVLQHAAVRHLFAEALMVLAFITCFAVLAAGNERCQRYEHEEFAGHDLTSQR